MSSLRHGPGLEPESPAFRQALSRLSYHELRYRLISLPALSAVGDCPRRGSVRPTGTAPKPGIRQAQSHLPRHCLKVTGTLYGPHESCQVKAPKNRSGPGQPCGREDGGVRPTTQHPPPPHGGHVDGRSGPTRPKTHMQSLDLPIGSPARRTQGRTTRRSSRLPAPRIPIIQTIPNVCNKRYQQDYQQNPKDYFTKSQFHPEPPSPSARSLEATGHRRSARPSHPRQRSPLTQTLPPPWPALSGSAPALFAAAPPHRLDTAAVPFHPCRGVGPKPWSQIIHTIPPPTSSKLHPHAKR